MIYVLKGRLWIELPGKELRLQAGQLVFISPFQKYKLEVEPFRQIQFIRLELNLVGKIVYSRIPETTDLLLTLPGEKIRLAAVVYVTDQDRVIFRSIQLLDMMRYRQYPGFMVLPLVHILLLELKTLFQQQLSSADVALSEPVQLALTILNHRYTEPISVDSLAKEVSLSTSRLQHLFRNETEMTIIEKVHELRINAAKNLLTNSDKAVTDIAFELGFNSRQHFTSVFKKLTEETPSAYRNRRRLNLDYRSDHFM